MSESSQVSSGAETRSPGQVLAEARTARGLSVTDLAVRLKFSPRQIEALEADHYDVLPGITIVRGMMRGYARAVGLDPGPLLAALDERLGPAHTVQIKPHDIRVPFPQGPRKGSRVYVLLIVLIVVAAGGVLAEWLLRMREPAPVSVAPAEPAVQVASSAAAPTPAEGVALEAKPEEAEPRAEAPPSDSGPDAQRTAAGANRIELRFAQQSWVEIKDARGRIVFSQLNLPNTQQEVEGTPPFVLVIGNASGVKLRYKNADVDLAPYTRTDVARLTLE